MRVGFFAPMPPAPTGVADYTEALFDALKSHGSVTLNDTEADVALYHVGNNHLHREIYARALEHPGVVVLHDAVLHHFFLGTLDEAAYIEEFVFNYGEWMRGMAEELWRNRARSASDPRYFEYPMLRRVATCSRAVIVHNPAAALAVRRHAPDITGHITIWEIPHLFVAPKLPDFADVSRLRAELGLGPRTLLVAVFGHMRESKRLPAIVRAVHAAWAAGADVRLLIAGTFASSDLERSATTLLDDPRIMRTGFLPEADFWLHACAADVCVNLRFPTAGETSGIAIRLMGIGKPVVFTAGDEIARIPENACLRVDAGAAEEEMLSGTIEWLASDREAAGEIGKRAARHIAAEHGIEKAAAMYWDALTKVWQMHADERR
jgi:glycosyltransferase involved in cell wall biosynthesis